MWQKFFTMTWEVFSLAILKSGYSIYTRTSKNTEALDLPTDFAQQIAEKKLEPIFLKIVTKNVSKSQF